MSLVLLQDIETPAEPYPDASDPEVASRFLGNWADYVSLARRMIRSFAHPNAQVAMLDCDDAVDFVAHEIMRGDWRYDGSTQPNTWRGCSAKYAIKTYCKLLRRMPLVMESLDALDTPGSLNGESKAEQARYMWVVDKSAQSPLELLIEEEEWEEWRRFCDTMLSGVSPKQRECLRLYVEGLADTEIGRRLGLTRQDVQQKMQRAIAWMKEASGVAQPA